MSKKFSYTNLPNVRFARSQQDLSYPYMTAFNMGDLVPVYIQEVYPGDTFKERTSFVIRTSTPFVKPIYGNMFADLRFFFVPHRLVYDNWANVMGENTESAWANTRSYTVPVVPRSSSSGVALHSLADYFGLPLTSTSGDLGLKRDVQLLPFRGFALIYDQWYRNQNVIDPMHIQKGAAQNPDEALNAQPWSPNNYTGMPPKVAKFHDYFTTAVPSPQKGDAVSVPIEFQTDTPVVTGDVHTSSFDEVLHFATQPNIRDAGDVVPLLAEVSSPTTAVAKMLNSGGSQVGSTVLLQPSNLWAQTRGLSASGFTVNDLRLAFQTQKMLEADAMYGSRLTEILSGHWSVSAPDARLQRTEYLGGTRVPLHLQQVAQTSSTSANSAIADVAAFLHTSAKDIGFTKSFVEWGYVIGVMCVRQFHTYTQGIERFWTRTERYDFYDPIFSHIGYQPIYSSELVGAGAFESDPQIFGYNEAWADLRSRNAVATSDMRPGTATLGNAWTLADIYANTPSLSAGFLNETTANIDRVLSGESSDISNFVVDMYHKCKAYRVMPTYSTPGLIDHK